MNQEIGQFVSLVGPNASGKTTFLDVIRFLGDLMSFDLGTAISERTNNPVDLVWGRSGAAFELAIDATIPREIREALPDRGYTDVRYELKIEIGTEEEEPRISAERLALKFDKQPKVHREQRTLFPEALGTGVPDTIYQAQLSRKKYQSKTIVHKQDNGNDNYYSEMYEPKYTDSPGADTGGKGWIPSFRFGPKKSALANVPDDGTRFPVSMWFRNFLTQGVHSLVLNSLLIRNASRPGLGDKFVPDGSNLPWVVEKVRTKFPQQFGKWIEHIQTAFPDIEEVKTVERPDDRHRYLVLRYRGGMDVPSWMVSDGTLRFLALTLIAYLPSMGDLYLIEEPENGIHPKAIEALFQSLSSAYDSQVIIASHSTVMLSMVEPDQVLCFAKINNETDIVSGKDHPALKEWRGECSFGTLFASGILG